MGRHVFSSMIFDFWWEEVCQGPKCSFGVIIDLVMFLSLSGGRRSSADASAGISQRYLRVLCIAVGRSACFSENGTHLLVSLLKKKAKVKKSRASQSPSKKRATSSTGSMRSLSKPRLVNS